MKLENTLVPTSRALWEADDFTFTKHLEPYTGLCNIWAVEDAFPCNNSAHLRDDRDAGLSLVNTGRVFVPCSLQSAMAVTSSR